MQLTGFHHLTAITANARGNHAFYTDVLGMRLVKLTVNQDDVSAYHLFYADGVASPGSDVTFFDWPSGPERRGTNSICRTGLRVASKGTLAWWLARFDNRNVVHTGRAERDGRPVLDFEDSEGQRLSLVVDEAAEDGCPWDRSPVPMEHQILGLGPVTISVPQLAPTDAVLRQVLEMQEARRFETPEGLVHVYEMNGGGRADTELHVLVDPDSPPARQGAGGVHHVAFRTPDLDSYNRWAERLKQFRLPSSGPVDRFYFRSLYFREPSGILIEIATDGPGFATDEDIEHLGERLSLPPFLEPRRREIEAGLTPVGPLLAPQG